MKQLVYFIIAFALYFFVQATADAQSFKVEGKTYSSVSSSNRTKAEPEKTEFVWTDKKEMNILFTLVQMGLAL